jgi:hypothetical protein
MLSSKARTLICLLAVNAAAWLLSGCQANTIYFGTNTQFGIRAGVDTKQIPEVEIGYNRQEGVMLPLAVECALKATNAPGTDATSETGGAAGQKGKQPATAAPAGGVGRSFIGENKQGDHKDAYSVIAIFSGKAHGNASAGTTNSVGAGMGVAQYFATGVAAQLLAEQGATVVGGASSAADSAAALARKLQNTADTERAAILAYVTKPDKTLDIDRVKAVAGTSPPPFAPNDVASFLAPAANAPAPTLDGFKSRLNPGGCWVPYIFTWYSTYTNITGTTKP